VSIGDIDRSACGGTHLRSTGEIGSLLLGKTEKIRSSLRVEFFAAARAEREIERRLAEAAQQEKTLRSRVEQAEKLAKKLSADTASRNGTDRYAAAPPPQRWIEQVEEITELLRLEVTAFTAGPGAAALLYAPANLSLLLAAHPATGLDCGQLLKEAFALHGGKGGGSPRLAQGSATNAEALGEIIYRFRARL
jgi:alanyl-tRNA synthetase